MANRYYILLINITTGLSLEVKSNCTNAVAVDFDWQDQYIYWSDITFTSSSISRKPLNDTKAQVCPWLVAVVVVGIHECETRGTMGDCRLCRCYFEVVIYVGNSSLELALMCLFIVECFFLE